MIKYFCDLCGQPTERDSAVYFRMELGGKHFTTFVGGYEDVAKGGHRDVQLCRDCAVKIGGQALGILPSTAELKELPPGDKKDIYGNVK